MAQDEADIRLALLQTELASIESGIRAFDTVSFQVKGWCVTATVALAGFAVQVNHKLLLIAAFAVVGFWLVDAQNRQLQRGFILRNEALRESLSAGVSKLLVPGSPILSTGVPELRASFRPNHWSLLGRLRWYTRTVLREAVYGHTLGLYLFLLVALCVTAALVQ